MASKVLKPFRYAPDRINFEELAEGDVRDFPADLLPGLVAEGFVSKDDEAEPVPPAAPAKRAPSAKTKRRRG